MAARQKRKQPMQRPQVITPIVTPGSPVRLQQPRSYDRQPQQHYSLPDIEVGTGFMQFLREHAVVALAIGFVIATQIQSLAKQLIASFVDPAFKLLFGEALSKRTFTLHFHGRVANFGWGNFVYAVLDVFFVLLGVYIAVKLFRLENLENPKKKKAKSPDDE